MKKYILLLFLFTGCVTDAPVDSTTADADFCGRVHHESGFYIFATMQLRGGTGVIIFDTTGDNSGQQQYAVYAGRDSILSYHMKGDSVSGIVADQLGRFPTPFVFYTKKTYFLKYSLGDSAYWKFEKYGGRGINIGECF